MRYYCPSAIFDYLGGQMGGQNGRKSANIEVKNKKSAKMDEILNACIYAIYEPYLQILCFSLQKIIFRRRSGRRCFGGLR